LHASPYGVGSVQFLCWECLFSASNPVSNSVNICFLHHHHSSLARC
jgi:hypothetical protein